MITTPANCADAIHQRQADVGISLHRIPAARHVQILPGMSIASKREVKSVLLLSKMPLGQSANRGAGRILAHVGGAGANPDAKVLFAAGRFFPRSA